MCPHLGQGRVSLKSSACDQKPPTLVSDKDRKKPVLRKVQQVCSIPFRSTLFPSYFHSFGMSENYIVFVEQPFKLDMVKLATAYFRGVTWGSCLKFDKDDAVSPFHFLLAAKPEFQVTKGQIRLNPTPTPTLLLQTLFHVINRTTGKAVSSRFYGDALVVFHHVNAYEDGGHLVCDLITYSDSSLYDMFYIRNIRQDTSTFVRSNQSFSPPVCKRFVFPLDVNKVRLVRNPPNSPRLNVWCNT